jgi:hypothetical protein
MDWKISWINPQNEPTYYAITLLVDGITQERIDKVYKKPVEITPEFLALEAQKEIARIESELNPPALVVVEEVI